MADNWEKIEIGDVWDFEKEDTLIGVFVDKQEGVGPNNSMLYEIELKDGKRVSIWGSTVLDVRLKNLEVGEEIKIVYLGMAKSQHRKGAEYKNYDVWHRPSPLEKVSDDPGPEEENEEDPFEDD